MSPADWDSAFTNVLNPAQAEPRSEDVEPGQAQPPTEKDEGSQEVTGEHEDLLAADQEEEEQEVTGQEKEVRGEQEVTGKEKRVRRRQPLVTDDPPMGLPLAKRASWNADEFQRGSVAEGGQEKKRKEERGTGQDLQP